MTSERIQRRIERLLEEGASTDRVWEGLIDFHRYRRANPTLIAYEFARP